MDILNKDKITFKSLEQTIFDAACQAAREATIEFLSAMDEQIHENRDKKAYRDKGLRKTTIKTIYGEVEYLRHVYLTKT